MNDKTIQELREWAKEAIPEDLTEKGYEWAKEDVREILSRHEEAEPLACLADRKGITPLYIHRCEYGWYIELKGNIPRGHYDNGFCTHTGYDKNWDCPRKKECNDKCEIIPRKKAKTKTVKGWVIPWTLKTPSPTIVTKKDWADAKYEPCTITYQVKGEK